jgi:hypothetical protein
VKKAKKAEELFCLCRMPAVDNEFMVQCDQCEDWSVCSVRSGKTYMCFRFHPRCVGSTRKDIQAIESYICPTCRVCPFDDLRCVFTHYFSGQEAS